MIGQPKDIAGQRFGRLVAVSRVLPRLKGCTHRWLCNCDCGKTTVAFIEYLMNGDKRSCGCLAPETLIKRNTKHGAARRGAETTEFHIWEHMIDRCHQATNDAYPGYGGRGIIVCEEWRNSFATFFKHVGLRPSRKHSLDRIDNNGNYEPGNVRWATTKEQSRNRRSNVHILIDGKKMTLAEAIELAGLPYGTVHRRIKRYKWAPARALELAEGRTAELVDREAA